MMRRPPRSTPLYSSAASDVYKRQAQHQQHFTNPSSSASPRDILHVENVGKLEEVVRCFSAAQQQWWRRRRVAVLVLAPRVKPERQMKKMEHRTGTFFRTLCILQVRVCIADRAPRCIADRGTAEAVAQQQQHSSIGGNDVAATDEKDERGCTGEPFVFVLARNLKSCLLYTSPSPRD